MTKTEKMLLDTLKEHFCRIFPDKPFQNEYPQPNADNEYYLYSLSDNLCEPMSAKSYTEYYNGNGTELNGKMKALRSSSAMTYNIFCNDEKIICRGGYGISSGTYSLSFEKKLPTLKTNRPPMANLDAFLIKDDNSEIIACEMKMFEWLSKNNSELKDAYSTKEYYKNEKIYVAFSDLIDCLKKEKSCKPKMNRYDCFQMLKHLLAVYNYCIETKDIKKFTLVNCVWELNNSIIDADVEKYKKYTAAHKEEINEANEFINLISRPLMNELKTDVDFEVKYIPLHEFIKLFDIPQERLKYLRRYTF